jgi:Activator of Hsp90 ATPase homolog 1-like protein
VRPFAKIAFTWGGTRTLASGAIARDMTDAETLVIVEFVPHGKQTEVVITHHGLATELLRDGHNEGLKICLDNLEGFSFASGQMVAGAAIWLRATSYGIGRVELRPIRVHRVDQAAEPVLVERVAARLHVVAVLRRRMAAAVRPPAILGFRGGEGSWMVSAQRLSPAKLTVECGSRGCCVQCQRLAYLQIDLTDPDFHAITLAQFRVIRAETTKLLAEAVTARELHPCDISALARLIQQINDGAMLS